MRLDGLWNPRVIVRLGVLFVFSLEPGRAWEYRESCAEQVGGLNSIMDDTTRF